MKEYFDVLESVVLLNNIQVDDYETLLSCLGAEIRNVKKNEIVLLAGNKPSQVGILLTGRLHIRKEDVEGNRSLIATIMPGEVFAEVLCCADVAESPVTVISDVPSGMMLLNFSRILKNCSCSCTFHHVLIKNMMQLIAMKNLKLQFRMEIISLKSVRMKVMRYLESFVAKQGRNITIPFNREELADFLCVERSALSHELSRMKKEGLIDYHKNNFLLKNPFPN